jgi:hypothetical protein
VLVDGAAPPRLQQLLQTFKRDVRRTVAPTIRSACSLAHHHPPRALRPVALPPTGHRHPPRASHRSLSRPPATAIHRAPCTARSPRRHIHRSLCTARSRRPSTSTARFAPPDLPPVNIRFALHRPISRPSTSGSPCTALRPSTSTVQLPSLAAQLPGLIDRATSITCATVDLARDRLKAPGSHAHPAALLMPPEPSVSSRRAVQRRSSRSTTMRAPRPRGVALATATALYTTVALRRRVLHVTSALEARAGLVPTSVFKTDGTSRERRFGGFDSLAFPRFETARVERREPATFLGPT